MEFFKWDEKYSTNIDKFDADHKHLIALFNNVYDRVFQCEDIDAERELTDETLNELGDYARDHFAAEEELMVKFNYPEYKDHKEKHDAFISEVNKLIEEHVEGRGALSFPTFLLVKEWITDHILIMDKKYGVFFNEKGIK